MVKESLRDGIWLPLWHALLSGVGERALEMSEEERSAAQISLLLHLAPNLTSFAFSLWSPSYINFGSGVFRPLDQWSASLKLESVKRLTVSGFEFEHVLDLTHIIDILRATPNLEVLNYRNCVERPEDLHAKQGRTSKHQLPRLSKLSELCLSDCSIEGSGLRKLLGPVGSKLSKVTITTDPEFFPYRMKLGEAPKELEPYSSTIKVLRLELPIGNHAFSLWRFGGLEVLDLDIPHTGFTKERQDVFVSSLPPSLRELRLVAPQDLSDVMTGIWSAFLAGQLPRLSKIHLGIPLWSYRLHQTDQALETVTKTIEAFRSVKVDAVFV